METIKDTTYDFVMVLRQMYTEAIIRTKLNELGAPYHQSVECIDFSVDDTPSAGDYAVTSTFVDKETQETFALKRC